MSSVSQISPASDDTTQSAIEVLSLLGESVWDWDIERDTVSHNRRWYQMLGLSEEIGPHPMTDFLGYVHPDDADRVHTAITECLAGIRSYDCEFRMLRADGQTICVHDRGEVLERSPDGKPLRMAGIAQDITAKNLAEQSLKESETRFRHLAENVPGAIFRYILYADGSDEIEYMSSGCIDLWELPAEELQNDPTPLWAMIDPDDLPKMQQSVMQSAETLEPWSYIWRITTPSGQRKWLQGTGVPERLPEGGVLWNTLILDITEQKLQEREIARAKDEAEAANRAKSEFLAHMSHELRTPLNAIIGLSEIMERQMFGPHGSPRYLEYSGMIHSSASHLLDLLADILDVSVIETGNMSLNKEWFDLGDAMDFSHKLLAQRICAAGLSYQAQLPSPEPRIFGDPIRIKQVLINLLSNAIKFSEKGGQITVSGRYQGECLELRVRDNGIGIKAEDLPQVTEAFRRMDRDPAHAVEGIGLGLYISSKIMHLHGGTLEIKSKSGDGTEVILTFPATLFDRKSD